MRRREIIRLETEAPVDDVLIETDQNGLVFIQAKSSIDLAVTPTSPLGKTAEQFVRQWLAGGRGKGGRIWDRPLSVKTDRLVLITGPNSSKTITRDLVLALEAQRAAAKSPFAGGVATSAKKIPRASLRGAR